MTKKEKLILAYESTERMRLLPFLKREVDAVLSSLKLVRDEDLED